MEQRLVGLMGCTAEEAKALSGIMLRHRKLTATLRVAATLALGTAATVSGVGSSDDGLTRTALVQSESSTEITSSTA